MRKLTKQEVASRYINDMYKKRYEERQKRNAADIHAINNIYKIEKTIRRRKI